MIDLYTWTTPNGRKISIMLEECGLPYSVHPVNIGKGEQFAPRVRRHQPEQQDPGDRRFRGAGRQAHHADGVGRDPDLLSAKKRASSCRGPTAAGTWRSSGSCSRWAAWGRCSGRCTTSCAPRPSRCRTPIERYTTEQKRLYKVLDDRLAQHEYLADEYSIADIATYPWVARYDWHPIDLGRDYPEREALVRRHRRAAGGAAGNESPVLTAMRNDE